MLGQKAWKINHWENLRFYGIDKCCVLQILQNKLKIKIEDEFVMRNIKINTGSAASRWWENKAHDLYKIMY